MARIVTITQPADTVRCGPDGRAEYVFTIHNISGAPLRVGAQLQVDEPTQKSWLNIQGPAERDLGENASEQITVQAQVPPDTDPGKYKFRLLVYSVRRPGEDYTEGETVALEVPAKEKKPEPPPDNGFPWWIAAVAAAVLLIGGIIGWLLWEGAEEPPELVEVPTLTGDRLPVALQEITSRSLSLGGVTEQAEQNKPQGTVLDQNPASKEQVEKGTEVFLVVAKEPGRPIEWTISEIEVMKQATKHINKTEQAQIKKLLSSDVVREVFEQPEQE